MIYHLTNHRQAERDEFAARMQREIEASRTPQSRDTLDTKAPRRDYLDTGFHPRHSHGRK